MTQPEISIVVPARLARETIAATIQALLEQCAGLESEVIAVVSREDTATGDVLRGLAGDPRVRLIEMEGPRSAPELRGEGIRAARGRLVAITEDHCLFCRGWVQGFLETHEAREVAAVGGPVENGCAGGPLDWAIYFSRYLGAMPPVGRGVVTALPGNNACYRREVLERFAHLYAQGFWEHDFNAELVSSGYLLWREPDLTVTHHKPYRYWSYLALRWRHARCFGGQRRGGLVPALAAPLLPALLAWRAVRAIRARQRRGRELAMAFLPLLLCYVVWSWGELAGRLFGPGDSCSRTD